MFLQVIELGDSSRQLIEVQRNFRDQNNIGLSVRGSQSDVTGLSAHDFHDRNPSMAFGCCP